MAFFRQRLVISAISCLCLILIAQSFIGHQYCLAHFQYESQETAYAPEAPPDESDEESNELVGPNEKIEFNPVLPRKNETNHEFKRRINEFHVSSDFDYTENDEPKKPVKNNSFNYSINLNNYAVIFEFIFFVFIIGIGLWFIRKAIGLDWQNIFRNRKKISTAQFVGVSNPDDIISIDYQQEIQLAYKRNDYQALIRLHYLQLLYWLNLKAIIQWQPDKTDAQYQNEMTQHPYHRQFVQISNTYSSFWFGGKNAQAKDWEDFHRLLVPFIS